METIFFQHAFKETEQIKKNTYQTYARKIRTF